MGPTPLVLDPWREEHLIALGAWRDKSGLTLTATTEPDLIAMATNWLGMKWDQAGTTTDYASLDFIMPFSFAEADGGQGKQYDFKLIVNARKLDAASDENADLCIQAQLYWFTPAILNDPRGRLATGTVPTIATAATASKSLTTPALALLAAATVAADNTAIAGFATYEIDIGARIRAEGKALYAGDVCELRLSPNEAVGSGDMDLEIIGPAKLRLRRVQHTPERIKVQRDW